MLLGFFLRVELGIHVKINVDPRSYNMVIQYTVRQKLYILKISNYAIIFEKML